MAGLRAMEKICDEAIAVTSALARTTDGYEFKKSLERFWELYFGPMYIIERHQTRQSGVSPDEIESAMVRMGTQLSASAQSGARPPSTELLSYADAVKEKCRAYVKTLKKQQADSPR